ncbi:MAG: arsenate reductase (glutaredoxin) [Acidobacteria bacterium]|nr:arsenate reductase (glutaredoxin) [Acidobacteriota bacterium]MCB9399149.1 arsenate reductase (glutaredoxin) [Acidobacteriota bacterium]
MQQPTIFHNPQCSKSRETLQLLRDQGIEPEIFLYLKQPLTVEGLSAILRKLGGEIDQMVRFNEPLIQELGLDRNPPKSTIAWLETLVRFPKLLQRPIVIWGDRAVIGRPPENVLSLISQIP